MPRRTAPLLLLLAALLGASVLSGCATRDEAAPPQVGTGFPLEVTPPGGKPLKFDREPQRIVSLSPTATETLFAVGAGRQVVAVDSLSNFPEGAPHSKLSALTPDPAAIGGYAPDLVIVSADAGGKLTAALDKLGAKTLVLSDAKTLDDAFAQFSLLGKVTGHPAEGGTSPSGRERTSTRSSRTPRNRPRRSPTTTSWTRPSTASPRPPSSAVSTAGSGW